MISVYAQNRDYHDIVKARLKRLGRWLIETAGGEIKVFVDTAPVMEKPLAAAAGLGWQGKHTNLVGRDLGNWFFLGALFTTLDLDPTSAETDHCGSCRACLDICPTAAFPAPYQLDARRCISYLTIEHKGAVDPESAGADGEPDLRLRRLPGGLPVEQVRRGRERAEIRRAGGSAGAAARRRWRGWTTPGSGRSSPVRRSSGSAGTGSCGTCCMRSVIPARRGWRRRRRR